MAAPPSTMNQYKQLLAGVELVRRGVRVALAHAAARLEPLHVRRGREVLPDPHQEHQDDADGEGEAEIIMEVLRPFRPVAESLRRHQRQQQTAAEGDVKAGDAENHKTRGGQPMHKAFEAVEAHDGAAGAATFDLDRAAPQIEEDEQRQHADDGNTADPHQRDGAEFAPFAAGRVNEVCRLLVGNADLARDHAALQLVHKLLLAGRRGRTALRRNRRWHRHRDNERKRQGPGDQAHLRKNLRHAIFSHAFPSVLVWRNRRRGLPPAPPSRFRSRSTRGRPSASPRRRSRSRAWPRALCRSWR